MYSVRNSVKALIIERNRLLCIRKTDASGPYYILPGGGQEKYETFPETLIRECREELGAEIEVGSLRYIREYIAKNHEFCGIDDNHQVEYMFACSLTSPPDRRKASHLDDGQDGIAWIAIPDNTVDRVYPKVLLQRLAAGYAEVYWGDVN